MAFIVYQPCPFQTQFVTQSLFATGQDSRIPRYSSPSCVPLPLKLAHAPSGVRLRAIRRYAYRPRFDVVFKNEYPLSDTKWRFIPISGAKMTTNNAATVAAHSPWRHQTDNGRRRRRRAAVIKHRSHDDGKADYRSPMRPARARERIAVCPGGGAADYYTRGKRKTTNGSHLIDDDVKSISRPRSLPALRSRCCRLAVAHRSSESFISSYFPSWQSSALVVVLQRDVRLRMLPGNRIVPRCVWFFLVAS